MKAKKMTAAVRKENGELMAVTSEYSSKKAFREDLNANGYVVIGRITVEGEEEGKHYRTGLRA